jgi:radical SAM superfamily enzyme YgiQ (UPF0313 family)
MRILLISSNRHDRFAGSLPVRPIPLGLGILLGALRGSRHRVHLLDLMFTRAPRQAIRRAIAGSSPDLIGISVRNLDAIGGRREPTQRVRSFLPDIQTWIHACRQEIGAPIVLGGPAVSLLPQDAFAVLQPDFILAGDASRSFPELMDRLDRGVPWEDLPGLVFRAGANIRVNPSGQWDASEVSPCYEALDLPRYEAAGYGVAVLTKTWPYIRTHGPMPVSAMGDPIQRPIPALLEDLRDLRTRLGVRRVFLADSGFNVPLQEAKILCRAVRETGLDLVWATGLQPGHMDAELAHLMRGAGCRMALLAGPGPIQEPLRELDRHLAELAATAELLRAAGVPLVLTVSFGRPGETRETVERTLALLARLDPAHVQLSAGVRILPFTPLAEQAKAEGVIRRDGDCLYPVSYLSPELEGWLSRRLRAAARGHPSWHVV